MEAIIITTAAHLRRCVLLRQLAPRAFENEVSFFAISSDDVFGERSRNGFTRSNEPCNNMKGLSELFVCLRQAIVKKSMRFPYVNALYGT